MGAGCTTFAQFTTTTSTFFSDSGLSASTTYVYRVRAYDNAGNNGSYSNTGSATTQSAPDTTPPTTPTNLVTSAASSTQINLTWNASTDNVGVTAYRVYRGGALIATPGNVTSYQNTGLSASTTYSYTVSAGDAAGNWSTQSTSASATTLSAADTQAPSTPTGLSASAASSSQINLSWSAPTDNVGVTAYRVYRGGALIATLGNVTSYQNTGLSASTTYSYTVSAGDAAGNWSTQSTSASATTLSAADTQAPSTPTNLVTSAASSSAVNLSWGASTDSGGSGLVGYKIERCTGAGCTTFVQIGTTTSTFYSDGGLSASTTYNYRVRAYDNAGNNGSYSNTGSATTPPTTPTNLFVNGGFESGATAWAQSSSGGYAIINSDPAMARTGSSYAWLGGYSSGSDVLYQDFLVPAGANPVNLQFWYILATAETSTTTAYDTFKVRILNPSTGTILATPATYSNLTPTSGWTQSPAYDLSAFAGQVIRLQFNGTTDSSLSTSFFLDDISVTAMMLTSMADLSVTQSASPNPVGAGKDLVYTLTVANAGPSVATGVTLTDTLPAGSTFVWATPGCANASGIVTCTIGTLANAASTQVKLVARPSAAGAVTNNATVSGATIDPNSANDSSSSTITVSTTPMGTQALRYRLYSPVTLEHHFTTDLNEYNVLGGYVGTWVQEGTVGKVLNNPGSFGGVTATPYYRLYNTSTQWHHWTTDVNEYYTLIQFPWWTGEGVDGYILPTTTIGATQLYRLLYPFIPGLHHWTIDPTEYGILISTYGWIGEGGSGFVVQ